MGKKKKKNKYKYLGRKKMNSFLSENKMLMAALGGAAAGISLAALLGTEKAKQIVDNIGDGIKNISDKIENGFNATTERVKAKSKKATHLEEQTA